MILWNIEKAKQQLNDGQLPLNHRFWYLFIFFAEISATEILYGANRYLAQGLENLDIPVMYAYSKNDVLESLVFHAIWLGALLAMFAGKNKDLLLRSFFPIYVLSRIRFYVAVGIPGVLIIRSTGISDNSVWGGLVQSLFIPVGHMAYWVFQMRSVSNPQPSVTLKNSLD